MTDTPLSDEQYAAIRARIAEAIRTSAYDCDGLCNLTEGDCDREHPIQVAVLHFGEVTDVYGDIEALAEVAHAAIQPELDRLRAERDQAHAQVAAALAVPIPDEDDMELMDPEQYQHANGYGNAIADVRNAIRSAAEES